MKYHFKIHREKDGFWAKCLELKGLMTQANDHTTLLENMKEALDLYLSEPENSKTLFPHPKAMAHKKNVVAVPVSPSVAIANRVRETRLKNKLTQIAMKEKLGIKNLSNYQRLEDPVRANPEWKTLVQIKRVFPEFQLDDLLAA